MFTQEFSTCATKSKIIFDQWLRTIGGDVKDHVILETMDHAHSFPNITEPIFRVLSSTARRSSLLNYEVSIRFWASTETCKSRLRFRSPLFPHKNLCWWSSQYWKRYIGGRWQVGNKKDASRACWLTFYCYANTNWFMDNQMLPDLKTMTKDGDGNENDMGVENV